MRRPTWKKWIPIAAAALSLSLLAAALTLVLAGTPGPVRQVFETASRPFSRLFSPVEDKVGEWTAWFQGMDALEQENAALRARLAEAEAQAITGQLAEAENARLRALLGWSPAAQGLTLEPAQVIRRTPDTWQRTVTVNKGQRDGVAAGNCAVDANGALIGRVTEAGETWSRVSLLTDPDFHLSGLATTSGTLAEIQGDLAHMAAGETTFTGLTDASPITLGEGVVTLAPSGTYPSGLAVGTLTSMEDDPGGLTQTAALTPAADLDHLTQLYLITAFREDT